jgi:hypothetical protein
VGNFFGVAIIKMLEKPQNSYIQKLKIQGGQKINKGNGKSSKK